MDVWNEGRRRQIWMDRQPKWIGRSFNRGNVMFGLRVRVHFSLQFLIESFVGRLQLLTLSRNVYDLLAYMCDTVLNREARLDLSIGCVIR